VIARGRFLFTGVGGGVVNAQAAIRENGNVITRMDLCGWVTGVIGPWAC